MPMIKPLTHLHAEDHSGAVPVCESTGETLNEAPKGKSKALKRVALKNAAEKSAFVEVQRRLEIERRSKQTELSKEEKNVQEQLLRLQKERSFLADLDELSCDDANSDVFIDHVASTCPVSTDPYPVTITPRFFGSRTSRPSTGESEGRSNGRTSRKASTDLLDLELQQPPGRLPPLQVSSSRLLSPKESSASSLSRTDSAGSVRSLSPKELKEFWAGTPEAISSVRRARKTPSQQRFDHQWSRSQSLKERTQRMDSNQTTRSMIRSNSVKEWRNSKGREHPPPSPTCRVWSRSRSLKESHTTLTSSIDSMNESLAEVELVGSRPSLTSPEPTATSELWLREINDDEPDDLGAAAGPLVSIGSPVPLPPIGSTLLHDDL